LASRPEDLRALVLDQLARVGARFRGEPVGVEDRALARLMDHNWPGNDVELADVLLRAALVARGQRVTLEDLQAIGFLLEAVDPDEGMEREDARASSIPKPRRRRR
jgi:DNA-binding NtrC family response regulator